MGRIFPCRYLSSVASQVLPGGGKAVANHVAPRTAGRSSRSHGEEDGGKAMKVQVDVSSGNSVKSEGDMGGGEKRSWEGVKSKESAPLFADKARKSVLDRMIRVDHAGELGARQIYAGQLAVFRGTPIGPVIQVMIYTYEQTQRLSMHFHPLFILSLDTKSLLHDVHYRSFVLSRTNRD